MGEILGIIEKLSGGACYQTEKFTLDHFVPQSIKIAMRSLIVIGCSRKLNLSVKWFTQTSSRLIRC
jgi:hypothetical protein